MFHVMNKTITHRIFLGLGGNLGRPLDCFIAARRQLAEDPHIEVIAGSPVYQTPAIGGPPGQADYLNAVLEIGTSRSPRQLHHLCREIEAACGRSRGVRWAARTLDIDLLFFGPVIADEARLTLPHPRLHSRHFVLLPLADLAPGLRHPRLRRTVNELLSALPEPVGIRKILEKW